MGCVTAAQIPEMYRSTRRTIGGLKPGESGWCVSWAISVDHDWGCWINPDHEVHNRPGGTVDTLVTRDADGWHVAIPRPADGWRLGVDDGGTLIPASGVDVVPAPRSVALGRNQ